MMKLTITAKLKIDVPVQEYENLFATTTAYKNACNYVSRYVYTTQDFSRNSVQDATYCTIRKKYGLRSQMACSVVRTVIASYKSTRSNGNKNAHVIFKKPCIDLVWNKDYTLKGNVFSINTLEGRRKFSFHMNGFEYCIVPECTFGTAKLVYKRKKFFLHIPVTMEIDELPDTDVANIVGIDRGIRFLAVTYNSKHETAFWSGSECKKKRAHYKQLRKELQQVRTPSSRRRLKAIGQRENRWMNDVNHRISKALVKSNPKGTMFVLEDLSNIRTATEKVYTGIRYETVSWSYYSLQQKLEYKALRAGQKVIYVSPKYTSQTCPVCGHTEKSNRNKKTHTFCCKNCGYTSNDDRIGAMNLYRKGIEYLVPDTDVAE